jgi:preprotein translocase subunit SecD
MAVMISFLIYSLAIFKIIDYAFSLSGIAAIILSLAMGIDANIIIYERIQEELKAGKSRSSAVDTAYARSWLAIRDGNATNIIVYIVLFGMGMSIFK